MKQRSGRSPTRPDPLELAQSSSSSSINNGTTADNTTAPSTPSRNNKFMGGLKSAVSASGRGVVTVASRTKSTGFGFVKDFKTFISRGNVIDLAVALVIGAAFTAIVNSFVKDLVTPLIGLAMGNVNLENLMAVVKSGKSGKDSYPSPTVAALDGAVTINYGVFIQSIISFLIVALFCFFLVRASERLKNKKPSSPTEHDCPYCFMKVDLRATRCGHCSSTVEPATPTAESDDKA